MFKETEEFRLITYRVISPSICLFSLRSSCSVKSKFMFKLNSQSNCPNLVQEFARSTINLVPNACRSSTSWSIYWVIFHFTRVVITASCWHAHKKETRDLLPTVFFTFAHFEIFTHKNHTNSYSNIIVDSISFSIFVSLLFAGEWNCWSFMETGCGSGLHLGTS